MNDGPQIEPPASETGGHRARAWTAPTASGRVRYGGAIAIVGACTGIAALMFERFELSNLTMVYLLGAVLTAVTFGLGPAILAAILGVAAFNFWFVPPRFTFEVADARYLVTFAVMFVVAIVTGTLTARLREQLQGARVRERRTAALYRLSHELVARSLPREVLAVAVMRIAEVLEARVAVVRPTPADVRLLAGDASVVSTRPEQEAARRAFDTGEGAGLEHVGGPGVLHLPLATALDRHGVVSVVPTAGVWNPERFLLLRVLVSQLALALERCRLAEEAHTARAQAETERSRSALLSSVSHDLRTPLATITGAATSLRDDAERIDDRTRRELAEMIADEGRRLDRLIGNILDMTRLESGVLKVQREWHSLEELVGAAFARLEPVLGLRPVQVSLPPDLPLVSLDDVLFEQVLSNLIENAHKYAPGSHPIEVIAAVEAGRLRLEVADRGPGLPVAERGRLFEKFQRGAGTANVAGAGLGLAICRGIVQAHGGTISAADRAGGGAVFTVEIPLEGEPPVVEREGHEATIGDRLP